ncbi:ABC transporter ATP-binding protein [Thermodesulfobacteriota bacterium]
MTVSKLSEADEAIRGVKVGVSGLSKQFQTERGILRAAENVSFSVQPGAFFTLLGPSGCGKSTTLRCIAGLEKPDSGEIVVGDQVLFSSSRGIIVPPHKRGMGMVFQSYAVWPHMTVFNNVAFPLRVGKKRFSSSQIKDKVMEALFLVMLTGMENRPAPHLSGGQQQRLALARALVHEPQVMLLDEPLSNLDAKLREQMRIELTELLSRLGITALYVTHDQVEALAMSHTIAVMREGRIIEMGAPKDIYAQPKSQFVADFMGVTNFFKGKIVEGKPMAMGLVETQHGKIGCYLPGWANHGDKVSVCIRPEGIQVQEGRPSEEKNTLEAKVEVVTFLGEFNECQAVVGKMPVRFRLHPSIACKRGESIFLFLPPEMCTVVTDE